MKTEKQVSSLRGEVAVLTPSQAEQYQVDFAPGFNLEALRGVDENPFFVTVKIRPGKGDQGTGPNYGDDILLSLQDQINERRPPGYKGHQDPDRVAWEYREPVTAWVGAKYVSSSDGVGELIVKGYVPPTAGDLRTQLQLAESGADVVNSVSIFGTRSVSGDQVKSFDLWSLDWSPKGREGMQTELVGVSGEQAKEEDEVTREEVIASLKLEEVPEHLVKSIQDGALQGVSGKAALADEIIGLLDLEEGDADKAVETVRDLVVSKETSDLETKLDEILEDKVTAEMARAAVKDAVLHKLSSASTDDEIAGEIAGALEKPYIAALEKGDAFPVISGGTGQDQDESRQGTAWE